jgi:hypothetical protein
MYITTMNETAYAHDYFVLPVVNTQVYLHLDNGRITQAEPVSVRSTLIRP